MADHIVVQATSDLLRRTINIVSTGGDEDSVFIIVEPSDGNTALDPASGSGEGVFRDEESSITPEDLDRAEAQLLQFVAEGMKEAVMLVVDDIRARVNKVPSAADIHVHSGDCDGSPEGALQAFSDLDLKSFRKLNIGEQTLPRYHRVYVQTCDLLKAEVTNRFDQNFLKPVVAMENVLLSAANGHDFSDALDKVMTSVGRTVTRPMFLLQSGGALGIARAKRFGATNSTNEPTEALFLAHEDTYLGQVHHVWSYCLVINNKAEYDHRAYECPKKKGVKDRLPRRQNARPSSTTSI
ncbi:hypothetical protein Bbelb_052060 [Branchiostoma belcheri]|nr:hypothetical protein Bbelb_052060 [Branchiostoma belcheri]